MLQCACAQYFRPFPPGISCVALRHGAVPDLEVGAECGGKWKQQVPAVFKTLGFDGNRTQKLEE